TERSPAPCSCRSSGQPVCPRAPSARRLAMRPRAVHPAPCRRRTRPAPRCNVQSPYFLRIICRRLFCIVPITEATMDGAVEKGCDDNTSIGLVRAILQRAPGAEADLFRRYQGAVSSIACMAGAGQWTADDVLQETFRIAIEKIRNGEVRDPERLPGF